MSLGRRGTFVGLLCLLCASNYALSRDVTFFVGADPQFNEVSLVNTYNRAHIDAMNGIPGIAYPSGHGTVATPRGVVVAGDLTYDCTTDQWNRFLSYYGLTGSDGRLHYPVYECRGNHDTHNGGEPVTSGIISRHGALTYSWNWDDVHIVCLDKRVDASTRTWLANDLAAVGTVRPVILYHHYGFDDVSIENWSTEELTNYAATIAGYNIVGIFHGHVHTSWNYTWQGYDVYSIGSPMVPVWDTSFAAVHLTDTEILVSNYKWTISLLGEWSGGSWSWHHSKTISPPGVTLSVSVTNPGWGSVGVQPSQPVYAVGSSVTLTATPSAGYAFSNWTGGVPGGSSTANPLTITMNTNKSVTAVFTPLYTLTVSEVNGSLGTVEVSPSLAQYPAGTAVTLSAIPNEGRFFAHWQIFDPLHPGDANYAVINTNNPLSIVMNRNFEVAAVFRCSSGASVGAPLLGVLLILLGFACRRS